MAELPRPPCTFCAIAGRRLQASFVYEADDIVAFMDIHPVNPGHVLVAPRQHFASIRMVYARFIRRAAAAVGQVQRGPARRRRESSNGRRSASASWGRAPRSGDQPAG